MRGLGWKIPTCWLAVLGVLITATSAQADTFGFVCITNDDPGDCAIGEAQLFVEVTHPDPPDGPVLFTFTNIGPEDSSICDVYFQDNLSLLENMSIVNGPGVSFSQGAHPGHLPGGNEISPPFQATEGLMAESDSPGGVPHNGVNPGEWLGISFSLSTLSSYTVTNVLDAIDNGDLRIGIRVQAFTGGGSESFVTVFPEPGQCDGSCEGDDPEGLCATTDWPECDTEEGTGICADPALEETLPAGALVVDDVDIGDPPPDGSEEGHNLQSWGPPVGKDFPGSGNWGGEDHCRVIWQKQTDSKSAQIDMDFGLAPGSKFLTMRWLDGIANDMTTQGAHDSFRFMISGSPRVYTLQDLTAGHPENWYDLCVWDVGELCGVHTITLTATGGPWAGFTTYGQVAFSRMATLCAPGSRSSTNTVVNAALRLSGVEGPVNRCIQFTARDSGGLCATPVDVNVLFAGSPAIGRVTFDIEEGDWTDLYAKDEQHVVGASASLVLDGSAFYSDTLLDLLGGDTDNNGVVDIDDVVWLITTFGQPANGGTHPWDGTRCADFSDNGFVGTEDFTFLAENWLAYEVFECGGGGETGGGGASAGEPLLQGASTSVGVAELPACVASRTDLNRDGVVNVEDVKRFEQLHGLGNELSSKMEMTASPTRDRPVARSQNR